MKENSEIDVSEVALLSNAVALWTGRGHRATPHRDESLLMSRFGDEVAAELIKKVRALEADFYTSDANLKAATLSEMSAMSVEHFNRNHPELPEEIAQAFAWCYTYDHK